MFLERRLITRQPITLLLPPQPIETSLTECTTLINDKPSPSVEQTGISDNQGMSEMVVLHRDKLPGGDSVSAVTVKSTHEKEQHGSCSGKQEEKSQILNMELTESGVKSDSETSEHGDEEISQSASSNDMTHYTNGGYLSTNV